ncbi:MAG: hypothetical protein ACE5EK_11265 [Nitrospinales bacterium]
MSNHFAKIESSERLRRLKRFIEDHPGSTSAEIIAGARVVALSAAVSELRKNGVTVDCVHSGVTADGSAIMRYWIHPGPRENVRVRFHKKRSGSDLLFPVSDEERLSM